MRFPIRSAGGLIQAVNRGLHLLSNALNAAALSGPRRPWAGAVRDSERTGTLRLAFFTIACVFGRGQVHLQLSVLV